MITIEVHGLDRVLGRMKNMSEKTRTRVDREIKAGALAVEADAKALCPVDTGRLRASIHTRYPAPLAAEVYTNVEYAPYVEFGTRRMAAQPYMRPAAEKNRKLIIRRITLTLQEAGA